MFGFLKRFYTITVAQTSNLTIILEHVKAKGYLGAEEYKQILYHNPSFYWFLIEFLSVDRSEFAKLVANNQITYDYLINAKNSIDESLNQLSNCAKNSGYTRRDFKEFQKAFQGMRF